MRIKVPGRGAAAKKALASICVATGLALVIPGAAASAAASRAAYTSVSGRLYGVVAISDSDAWAVGLDPGGSLIMHWNGSAWSQYLTTPGFFNATAASSARDVWAVGGTNWFSPEQPLAEHWNGSSWKQVATPSPAGGGTFGAVTATSPGNAWAVGLAAPGGPGLPSSAAPLIEHWNGRKWAIQSEQVPANGGEFHGVAATSPSNAWAVGNAGPNTGVSDQTLIEHWNGRSWTRVPSPAAGISSQLTAITVVSADNAWAVGYYTAANGTYHTLVLYWNGRRWTLVPSDTPGGDAQLLGVTASWTHNIWAVGITNPTRCSNGGPQCQTLIMHWNGVRWKVLPSPNPPSNYLNLLWGVSAVSRTNIWAAGTTDYGSTLIVHWNGSSWS
jgi:hypothetical protein